MSCGCFGCVDTSCTGGKGVQDSRLYMDVGAAVMTTIRGVTNFAGRVLRLTPRNDS